MSRHKKHLKNLTYMASQGFDLESVSYCCDLLYWSAYGRSIRMAPDGKGYQFRRLMSKTWANTPPVSDWGLGNAGICGLKHFLPVFEFSKNGVSFRVCSWAELGMFVSSHRLAPESTIRYWVTEPIKERSTKHGKQEDK